MDLKNYQELCKTTAKKEEDKNQEILNWGLGIAGEAGDVASCIKKVVFHKNISVKEGIKENLGDLMWYVAMTCNFFEWSFQDVLNENIEKLKKRHPQGFTYETAQRGGTMIKWSGEGEVKEVGNLNGN